MVETPLWIESYTAIKILKVRINGLNLAIRIKVSDSISLVNVTQDAGMSRSF